MGERQKLTFDVEELENGFLVVVGDRRLVSTREELPATVAGVLGVELTGKKKAVRKQKGESGKKAERAAMPAAPGS